MQQCCIIIPIMSLSQSLTGSGHRLTKIRKEILNVFETHHSPLSALEVKNFLEAKNILANRTTVYREIWFLREKGIVQELFLGKGKTRFELTPKHCHHHLVCSNCGNVEDVTVDDSLLLSVISTQSQFKLERHSIEFFGKCINCK